MAGEDHSYAKRAQDVLGFSRWWLLAAAAVMMAAVSPYQYVWSSIEGPIAERLDIALPALGAVFSLYVVFQSISQMPAGWWRDRRGPRLPLVVAALLAGGGYIGLAYAETLWQLYLLYSIGAVGVGIVYTIAVNTAVKWFPDRTGLTTGIGTMAFAAGSMLVVPYVRANATVEGYGTVLWTVGVAILVLVLGGALVLRDPPAGWDSEDAESATDSSADRTYTTGEMLRTWQFWLLYAMFIAIAGADLIVIANIVGFAEQFGFAAIVATVSATLLPAASGGSRIILGEIYDRFDRRYVMAGSFLLAGLFRVLLVWAGQAALSGVFVGAVVGAMFFSSPLYVFFPSVIAEYYGTAHSSSNYAVAYTAKIGGGVLAGTGAGLLIAWLGWSSTFLVGAGLAVAAAVGAVALRPPGATDTSSSRQV